jgi:hypothetical protein
METRQSAVRTHLLNSGTVIHIGLTGCIWAARCGFISQAAVAPRSCHPERITHERHAEWRSPESRDSAQSQTICARPRASDDLLPTAPIKRYVPSREARPAVTFADRPHDGRAMQGNSISAVHFERTAHPSPLGGVSADQRRCVVRRGVELPTFRFSGAIEPSRDVGNRSLIRHLAASIVARSRRALLDVCLRWLPFWPPGSGSHAAAGVTYS